MSCHSLVRPFDASCWSTTCGGKKVKQPFIFKITQQQLGGCHFTSPLLFSPLLMSHHLGMDEFTIFFLMTNDIMSLLEISLDVNVFTLSQCWQLLWVAVGHMCNVNMCITSCKQLCLWAH
jgi:hypothetical protein